MTWEIRQGDALERLREMPDESVQTCITSPPYWGLRDYGTAEWDGGDAECDHLQQSGGIGKGTLNCGPEHNANSTERAFVAYRDTCGKCGAIRVDSQLGLEPTPDEYVANLVSVFCEVRRVLRDDGTVWLNLGDSYASSASGRTQEGFNARYFNRPDWNAGKQADAAGTKPDRLIPLGLKPKDLVGIPWRVARALQEPYYTGTITDECDRIWLAAMIDAEGCMFIHKRKAGQSNGQGYVRKNDSYGAGLEVASTDRCIVEHVAAITGRGSICEQTPEQSPGRKQTIYRWNLRSNECREVVREVYPYLVAKQYEARLLLGCPSSGPEAHRAHESLKAIHQGAEPDIDFAAPEPMFERGWFLRSDIIWAKLLPNPMPESVTDRPTRSHEYLFLLTKSARYFYDADAIKEAAAPATLADARMGTERVADFDHAAVNFGEGTSASRRMARNAVGDPETGRNKRTVWTVATKPYAEAHFATFPPDLILPCVLAGSADGDTVLDPFAGAGTTGVVALRRNRSFVGIELNPTYCELARERIRNDGPLFNVASEAA